MRGGLGSEGRILGAWQLGWQETVHGPPLWQAVEHRGICRACGSDVQNMSGFCHQELSCATESNPQQHRKGRESPSEARAHGRGRSEALGSSDSAHLLTEGASPAPALGQALRGLQRHKKDPDKHLPMRAPPLRLCWPSAKCRDEVGGSGNSLGRGGWAIAHFQGLEWSAGPGRLGAQGCAWGGGTLAQAPAAWLPESPVSENWASPHLIQTGSKAADRAS